MFPAAARAIVFDVVGTLVEPAPAVADAYRAAALRYGIDQDAADIGRRFRAAWRRQETLDAAAIPAFATSGTRERERWRAIVADVFDATPQSDAIFDELWTHFGRPGAWRPIPAGRDLVRAARDAGLTVALASNFDERLFGIATVIEPLSWADHVFASSELGWRKPSAEFFRTVEHRLGRSPTELVLVGDDPELDIAAGRRAGWHVLPIG
jgi:putative hydrolase of the HAD superfamily